jgi:hypothetical protein
MNSEISGATVYLEMSLPGGGTTTSSGDTGTDGTVTFVYESGSSETGTYTSTVTDIAKTGYTYAQSESVETSESLTVP